MEALVERIARRSWFDIWGNVLTAMGLIVLPALMDIRQTHLLPPFVDYLALVLGGYLLLAVLLGARRKLARDRPPASD